MFIAIIDTTQLQKGLSKIVCLENSYKRDPTQLPSPFPPREDTMLHLQPRGPTPHHADRPQSYE